MDIQFDTSEKVNGKLTLTVETADIQPEYDKILKDYRKRANVPGFRPGQVPMSLIKRQVGPQAKMDALNKLVGHEMYKYFEDNKIQTLGQPMPNSEQEPVDVEKDGPYIFKFDVAIRPELNVTVNADTPIDYYHIKADDKQIDQQVDSYARRHGEYTKADVYDPAKNDMLKGDIRQLDEAGNTIEGGITVDSAVLMPEYIKVADQQKLFDGAKPGDIITFNPRKAYPDNDAEVASLLKIQKDEVAHAESDFSFQVTEIQRFEPAKVEQALFDMVYGKDKVGSVDEFRARIADELKPQLAANSDRKFLDDVRRECERQTEGVAFPEAMLKRILQEANKDKSADYVEKNFAGSLRQLRWQLIKEQLAEQNGINVEEADLKEAARANVRMQFAQYGMNEVPEEYVNQYADNILKKHENIDEFIDQALDRKLIATLKGVVKLNEKTVTLDEFRSLLEGNK